MSMHVQSDEIVRVSRSLNGIYPEWINVVRPRKGTNPSRLRRTPAKSPYTVRHCLPPLSIYYSSASHLCVVRMSVYDALIHCSCLSCFTPAQPHRLAEPSLSFLPPCVYDICLVVLPDALHCQACDIVGFSGCESHTMQFDLLCR
jgi:hypothetical protein